MFQPRLQVRFDMWLSTSRSTYMKLRGESKQHEAAAAGRKTISSGKSDGWRILFLQSICGRILASRRCQRCWWQWHISSMLLLEWSHSVVRQFPPGSFVPGYLASKPGSPNSLRSSLNYWVFFSPVNNTLCANTCWGGTLSVCKSPGQ